MMTQIWEPHPPKSFSQWTHFYKLTHIKMLVIVVLLLVHNIGDEPANGGGDGPAEDLCGVPFHVTLPSVARRRCTRWRNLMHNAIKIQCSYNPMQFNVQRNCNRRQCVGYLLRTNCHRPNINSERATWFKFSRFFLERTEKQNNRF